MCVTIADATQPDMPLVYANPAFSDVTGYLSEEIVGRNCRFLQGPETEQTAVAQLRSAIAEVRDVAVEFTNYRKDGSPFVNALRLAPALDARGRLIAYLGIQQDVTDARYRENREIDQQRLAALGQLAGGVSHQLNNLLQPVISLLALHRSAATESDEAADFDIMLTSARQAADVVRDVLAFSKGSDGVGRSMAVVETVNANTAFLKALLPEKIDMVVTVSDRVGDRFVAMDPTQFCQMLVNLLINATQAMAGEGVVSVELDAKDDEQVLISVSDNGPGISPEIRSRVLEPFFTTRSDRGGTGLGLSMVYGIVRSAGGTLTITDAHEDAPSPGCRVTLSLPTIRPAPAAKR